MQVNKALHTCTSWYAYAAMFGSSASKHINERGDGGGGLSSHGCPSKWRPMWWQTPPSQQGGEESKEAT